MCSCFLQNVIGQWIPNMAFAFRGCCCNLGQLFGKQKKTHSPADAQKRDQFLSMINKSPFTTCSLTPQEGQISLSIGGKLYNHKFSIYHKVGTIDKPHEKNGKGRCNHLQNKLKTTYTRMMGKEVWLRTVYDLKNMTSLMKHCRCSVMTWLEVSLMM